MSSIGQILENKSHRTWGPPKQSGRYYQEWNNALFLHWKVDAESLMDLVPKGMKPDTFEGSAWISLVAFTMQKIRPLSLPPVSVISNFHEVNVRTYLTHKEKAGVYFLNIEAEKNISSIAARLLSGLPYEKASISRSIDDNRHRYRSTNKRKGFLFDASFKVLEKIKEKSPLENWLSERYCLYLDKKGICYQYEVHHKEWDLYKVQIDNLKTHYRIGNLSLERPADLIHFSPGVEVVAWKRELINQRS